MTVAPTTADAGLFPPDAFDHLLYQELPLAGLGMALASPSGGMEYGAAIRAVTVPPSAKVGLRYPKLRDGSAVHILDCLFLFWLEEEAVFPGAPNPDHPALAGLSGMAMVPLLPRVDLPGTGDYIVAAEHFVLLLRRLALGDICVADLPVHEDVVLPRRGPLQYRRPVGRGPVTPDHIAAFAHGFPHLASALLQDISWRDRGSADAGEANGVVRRLLGIEADVRVGCLVSADEIETAICLASGDVLVRSGGSLFDHISSLARGRLETVTSSRLDRRIRNLRGAAWSCEVDALLSLPEACLM